MFRRRLAAMEREGELLQNRKGPSFPSVPPWSPGALKATRDGYGLRFVPDEGGEDIHLESKQMGRVLHGDGGARA